MQGGGDNDDRPNQVQDKHPQRIAGGWGSLKLLWGGGLLAQIGLAQHAGDDGEMGLLGDALLRLLHGLEACFAVGAEGGKGVKAGMGAGDGGFQPDAGGEQDAVLIDLLGGDACDVVFGKGVLHLPAGALPLAVFKSLAVWLVTPCGLLGEVLAVGEPCGGGAGNQQGGAGQPFKPKRRGKQQGDAVDGDKQPNGSKASEDGDDGRSVQIDGAGHDGCWVG